MNLHAYVIVFNNFPCRKCNVISVVEIFMRKVTVFICYVVLKFRFLTLWRYFVTLLLYTISG